MNGKNEGFLHLCEPEIITLNTTDKILRLTFFYATELVIFPNEFPSSHSCRSQNFAAAACIPPFCFLWAFFFFFLCLELLQVIALNEFQYVNN